MAKYLVITKDKDFIATKSESKRVTESLKTKCQIYDRNGRLVYPAHFYDGEDRIWAKEFIAKHKIGDSTKDVQEEYYRNLKGEI